MSVPDSNKMNKLENPPSTLAPIWHMRIPVALRYPHIHLALQMHIQIMSPSRNLKQVSCSKHETVCVHYWFVQAPCPLGRADPSEAGTCRRVLFALGVVCDAGANKHPGH